MLHYETIDAKTLALLKELQRIPIFKQLRLVGGTALALQLGHRKSIDIDLFGAIKSDEYEMHEVLSKINEVKLIYKTQNINLYILDGIKTDIVNYTYPWIEDAVIEDDIIMAGYKDIIAMKLAAITGRGAKKDFIDLYFLLQMFTLEQMLEIYNEKYKDGSIFMVLKSLIYFVDADNDEMPLMLKSMQWQTVKSKIKKIVEAYHKRNL